MNSNISIRSDLKLKNIYLWINDAFLLFRENPFQFIILEFFTLVFMLVPFVGAFISTLLVARFMYCAKKVEIHNNLVTGDIFRDLFANRMVVRLALLNFSISTFILLSQYVIDGRFSAGLDQIIISTILFVPSIILIVCMWLAPAICLFNKNVEPKTAMWLSFKACLSNVLVFIGFSILIACISSIIGLPLFLILVNVWNSTHNFYILIPVGIVAFLVTLVWLAILNLSTYCVYRKIYQII